MMTTQDKSVRRVLLEILSASGDHRFGRGVHYLFEAVRDRVDTTVRPHQVMELLWGLLAEGLAYVDYTQSAPENWAWVLTARGRHVVESGEYEPDDAEGYLSRLRSRIPDLDELVLLYAEEALRAYQASCHLASTVMLGVASERAFQLLGEALLSWLPEGEAEGFRRTFENTRRTYVAKFAEFRKRLEPHKPDLRNELAENMALSLDSVLDLLRVNRNDAGHPSGRRVDRDEAYINLQMFARYLETMFKLRNFFSKAAGGASGLVPSSPRHQS
jgi:hypothetical protein